MAPELAVVGCVKGRKGQLFRCYCYGADDIAQAIRIAKSLELRWAFVEDLNHPVRKADAESKISD